MKSFVFDAGPIISLTMNNLLWVVAKLKEHFNGKFYLTGAVKNELVDVPLSTKKFKFEAIQVMELINSGTLEVIDNEAIKNKTHSILETANQIFIAHEHPIKILHYGEVSVIAASQFLGCNTIAVDEKTTRIIMENPKKLGKILEKTLHTHIGVDTKKLSEFRKLSGKMKVIRSVEIISVAYELGILHRYIKGMAAIQNKSQQLLDAVLWGLKLSGCAVSEKEIRQIIKIET